MTSEKKTLKELKQIIESEVASGVHTLVRKVIVNKNARPSLIAEQFELLKWAIEKVDMPSYKVLAAVACAHKALESLDKVRCLEALAVLEEQADLIEKLSASENLREDVLHTFYSFSTVKIFLLIYLKEWEALELLIEESTLYYEGYDDIRSGFYQTCGNIFRCYGFKLLISVGQDDLKRANETLKKMELLLFRALQFSDDNYTKFIEYTTYINSLGKAREILLEAKVNNKIDEGTIKSFAKTLMRWQNPEKVNLLSELLCSHLAF